MTELWCSIEPSDRETRINGFISDSTLIEMEIVTSH